MKLNEMSYLGCLFLRAINKMCFCFGDIVYIVLPDVSVYINKNNDENF